MMKFSRFTILADGNANVSFAGIWKSIGQIQNWTSWWRQMKSEWITKVITTHPEGILSQSSSYLYYLSIYSCISILASKFNLGGCLI